jgi:adenosine deaminase CECR1
MGRLCSINREDSSHAGMDALEIQRFTSKLVNDPHHRTATAHITDTLDSTVDDMANKYDLVDALDRVTQDRRGDKNASRIRTVLDGPNRGRGFAGETGTKDGKNSQSHRDYLQERAELIAREDSLSWEFLCKRDASLLEKKADRILQEVRKHDQTHIFDTHPSRRGYRGQEHPRFQGDHFLYNSDLINQTILFQIASRMPKGAHLHIHFNANLLPHVLIDIAKGMERMFITSDIPLVTLGRRNSDPGYYDNFNRSRIRFKMLSETEERRTGTGNLFDPNYPPDHKKPMSFRSFLVEFGKHYSQCTVDEWLIDKLVFHEEEAHGWLQTADGAWDRFNARTQMMKGLFNYETAYREYTRRCLQDFADDGIQYAEIRVNFMGTNQLLKDNGEPLEPAVAGETANEQILKIIIDECTKFKAKYTHTKYRDPNSRDLFKDYKGQYLEGIKVIYCTPRSFEPEAVKLLLDECRQFKIKYPQWIAGE